MKNIFNKKIKSKDGKVVAQNFAYLSFLQIAGYVFPLLTIPYLARTIGAEGFGRISFASAVIAWVRTIVDWGFLFTATRDVAQNREDKEKVSEIFSNVLWARLLLSVVSGLGLLLLTISIPTFREHTTILAVSFLMVPGHIFFPDWFFQGIEKMKYTTIFNLCIKFIFTIAVFIFIREKGDYIYQPLLTSIGYLLCGIGAFYLIVYKWGYSIRCPQMRKILSTLKDSTDVFINNLMPNLYNSLSIVLLGVWGGPVANGIYFGGTKFVEIFRNLHQVLSRAFFPFLSRHKDKHRMFAFLNIGSASIGVIIMILFAPLIINVLMGDEFEDSVGVLRVLALSLIFLSISDTYGTNYLIINHQERNLRNCTMFFSVIGMLLAIPLIKNFTYMGVAMTILICRFFLGTSAFMLAVLHKRKHDC